MVFLRATEIWLEPSETAKHKELELEEGSTYHRDIAVTAGGISHSAIASCVKLFHLHVTFETQIYFQNWD